MYTVEWMPVWKDFHCKSSNFYYNDLSYPPCFYYCLWTTFPTQGKNMFIKLQRSRPVMEIDFYMLSRVFLKSRNSLKEKKSI